MKVYPTKKRSVRHLAAWLVASLCIFTSCSLQDVRDVCCEGVILRYRYISLGHDKYVEMIQTERHYLFDDKGTFMYEVPVDSARRTEVRLRNLKEGTYTMLTIGNRTEDYTYMDALKPGETQLKEVTLALQHRTEDNAAYTSAEELFWNLRTFEAKQNESRTYLCDMANIHCHLYIKIGWEGDLPEGSDRYTVELSNLVPQYRLEINPAYTLQVMGGPEEGADHNEPTRDYSVHHYPYSSKPHDAVVRNENTLRGNELFSEVRTLRYLDEAIPTLQLWHDGVRLFDRPIDLEPIFKDWEWYPNLNPEQEYRIELLILKNGQVVVKPWISAGVLDWEDGGSFGG